MPSPSLTQSCGQSFCGYQPKAPGQSWWYPELLRQYWPEPKTYRFWGGSQDLVIMVRKHEIRDQFVIVGSIQQQSNLIGNAPLNVTASILLEGRQLNFTVRRQGSVYLYSPAVTAAAAPSFVQLDGWHESSHFSHWANNFNIEAELHSEFQPADVVAGEAQTVFTEAHGWQADGSRSHDLRGARSFLSMDAGREASWVVEPRPVSRSRRVEHRVAWRSYRVFLELRASGPDPESTACVEVAIQSVLIGSACMSARDGWTVVNIGAEPTRLAVGVPHSLTARNTGNATALHLDAVRLVEVGAG